MKYIDEDLQNRRRNLVKNKNSVKTPGSEKKAKILPITPFTANELQDIEQLQTTTMKNRQKFDENFSSRTKVRHALFFYF